MHHFFCLICYSLLYSKKEGDYIMDIKERIMLFMRGRYGVDSLSRTILWAAIIIAGCNLFINNTFITLLSFALIIYCNFRMFSRNIYKRASENQKYLQDTRKVRKDISVLKHKILYLQKNHIYKCPTCKQKIRIPRGKGKISIHCPSCHTDFIKKS